MLFLTFDEAGSITYISSVKPTQYGVKDTFFTTYGAYCWLLVNGEIKLKDNADDLVANYKKEVLDSELVQLKSDKLQEVRASFQSQVDALRSKYAPYEIESFVDQRAEWRAYKNKSTALTPIVDTLANTRGIPKKDLLSKIEANVLGITILQGQQNALEDTINACTTLEELEAIGV